jgi:transposase-like protein
LKLRIVEETGRGNASVAEIARRESMRISGVSGDGHAERK